MKVLIHQVLLSINDSIHNGRLYQAEWTFPGTWIHNKTSEISYSSRDKDSNSWTTLKNKFCLPMDANNINTKWWNTYYQKISAASLTPYASNDPSVAELETCGSANSASFTAADTDSLKYNIHANTKKFGLFEWNIDISCFYALNGGKYTPEDEKKECPNSGSETVSMKIRNVDLGNLFPSKDDTSAVLSSTDTTGRTPGFNWSKYATNTVKDPLYTSRPSDYVSFVQSKGYSVYSEDYLDYEIPLTKETIQKIKSSDGLYNDFEGSIVQNGSVNTYRSDLLRDTSLFKGALLPNNDALKCNNIADRNGSSSSACENFVGGAE